MGKWLTQMRQLDVLAVLIVGLVAATLLAVLVVAVSLVGILPFAGLALRPEMAEPTSTVETPRQAEQELPPAVGRAGNATQARPTASATQPTPTPLALTPTATLTATPPSLPPVAQGLGALAVAAGTPSATPVPVTSLSADAIAARMATVVAQVTPISPPDVVAKVPELNVRAGPGPDYPITTSVVLGTTLLVQGRNRDGTWVQVSTPSGVVGWVTVQYVIVNVQLERVKVVDVPPARPAPAPSRAAKP